MLDDLHLAALHDALVQEETASAEEHRRLAALDPEARIAAGFAWPRLRVVRSERLGRRERLTLRALGGEMLHAGIGGGDPVWVNGGPGHCDGVERAVAEVVVDRGVPDGAEVEVTRRHDPATFVRYRQGLEAADRHRSPLREALLGGWSGAVAASLSELPELDEAQQRAAAEALGPGPLAVIHGPPGTGKTWVLARILRALVDRGERPWALADSNAAVDHLALQAAAAGVDVVRVGYASRIGSAAASLSLEARIESSPLGPALAALRRDLSRAWGTPEARALLGELREMTDQARDHALASAQCIAATFGTLARRASSWPAPTTAVVDEATQASEPAVWCAVPYVERLVLAGDPEQLGPVSRVPRSPLATSLLERLLDGDVPAVPMLEVQHRMSAAIRALVGEVYGPAYRDHPRVAGQALLDLPPITWVDTAGAELLEARDPTTQSLYNEGEVALVAMAVADLRARGVSPDRIAVLAPYSAQIGRLAAHPELRGVEVATINGFQGREQDAVAVSWVRSNHEGDLGFVVDPRRLTVALTRARCWLWQVGDTVTLSRHPRFASLIAHHAAHAALRSVWESPWAETLA